MRHLAKYYCHAAFSLLFAVTLSEARQSPTALVRRAVTTPAVELQKVTDVRAKPSTQANILGRIVRGSAVAVLSSGKSTDPNDTCRGTWYEIGPSQYICSTHTGPALAPSARQRTPKARFGALPFRYARIRVPKDELLPVYENPQQIVEGQEPAFFLERGDSVAVAGRVRIEGDLYWRTLDGTLVPANGVRLIGQRSRWEGAAISTFEIPFGWVSGDDTPTYKRATGTQSAGQLGRRHKVRILEERGRGRGRRLRIGPDQWVAANQVNEVRWVARPEKVQSRQWIDVDVAEQVMVLYEGPIPVWATLVSTGRSDPTPLGNYPIWAKVPLTTMRSPEEDSSYFVDRVPWVLFFQGHNALHAAYWHDDFGRRKSHGCVNLAPRDAEYVFNWVQPKLPAGWTIRRPAVLEESVLVHLRNSSARRSFAQQRPTGPPKPNRRRRATVDGGQLSVNRH